jgi:predicted flap endonuclease-1-like 5' DNA nuclease
MRLGNSGRRRQLAATLACKGWRNNDEGKNMIEYLPITISAIIIFTALMWWLLALGRVKKDATRPSDEISPKDISAPPVTTTPPPAAPKVAEPAKLMETAKAAPKPRTKAPAKAKAEKAVAAPAPTPKPKAVAPKAKPAATTKAATAAPKKAAAPAVKAAPAPKPKVAPAAKPKAAPAAKKAAPAPSAKPKAVAKPKAAPQAKPAPVKPSIPDDLALLKGVGPKLVAQLKTLGVTSFEQVASWSAGDIAEIDSKLGVFAGRITRDNWVDQAKLLVAGDVAGFEKKYGALGSEIAKG